MSRAKPQTIPDRIPADLSDRMDTRIEKAFETQFSSAFRSRVKAIFGDCTDTVAFMDKVREYAGRQIRETLFKNVWAILAYLSGLVAAAAVGAYISKLIK